MSGWWNWSRTVMGVGMALLAASSGVRAETAAVSCQRAIARASAAYVQGRAKALARCETARTRGRIRAGDACTADPATMRTLGDLWVKLFADINRSCGGSNRDCGDGDDLPLASTGWGGVANCPGFAGSACTDAIASCTSISSCLQCIDGTAMDQAVAGYAGAFDAAQFGTNSAVNRCQRAITKGASKFLVARSKALQRCWDARLRGAHANPCPDPGDRGTLEALAKAEDRKIVTICKSCGGADGLCDGIGDLSPAVIGFATSCPAVSPVGAGSCGGPIVDLNDIVRCIDCVAAFETDCADAAAVPQLVTPYPATCTIGGTTTTTTAVPTTTTSSSSTTTTTATFPTTTSTTIATTTSTSVSTTSSTSQTTTTTSSTTTTTAPPPPTVLDFTTRVAGGVCGSVRNSANALVKNLTCGGLNLGGGGSIVGEGPTPDGATNRFSLTCTGASCTVGSTAVIPPPDSITADCTAVGCNFGTPLPVPNPSIPNLTTCVLNTFAAPGGGTLNLSTGVASLTVNLTSDVYLTGNLAQPCPRCVPTSGSGTPSPANPRPGKCDRGPNTNGACTTFSATTLSRDCPTGGVGSGLPCTPGGGNCIDGSHVGPIPVNLSPLTTGTATSTATASGIFCPSQTSAGCFGSTTCRTITETGTAAGPIPTGTPTNVTVASTFCIPATGNGLVDASAALPGPGAVSLPGTFTVN